MISENNPDKMFKVAGLAEGGESWKAFFITCLPVVQQGRKTGGGGGRINLKTRDFLFLWGSACANMIVFSNWRVLRGLQ